MLSDTISPHLTALILLCFLSEICGPPHASTPGVTIATAGFQGVQRGAQGSSTGSAEATPDASGLFEELLAALSASIPFEGSAAAPDEETTSGDLGKQEHSDQPKEEDAKPAWRTGFGWLQITPSVEPAPTPVKLIPQALGLSVQGSQATAIESMTSTDTAKSTVPSIPEPGKPLGASLDVMKSLTGVKADEGTVEQQPKEMVQPPLAFELKIRTDATPPPEAHEAEPGPALLNGSQSKTRSEMGSGMGLNAAKMTDQGSIAEKPEPTTSEPTGPKESTASKDSGIIARHTETKHGKSNSDNGNNQPGAESHSHEQDPVSAVKTHNTSPVDSGAATRHERFSSDLHHVDSAPSQSVTETAVTESKTSTPTQPVTSLRLHLESENSATPVDLTVKERAGQVRIEVRDVNLGRNIELQEQLPDLLKRLEEQGFHGEASSGVGREIKFSASADANPGPNSDQQQQQQYGSGERRQQSRSDGDEESPSQRNRQDRSKWQSAWFDMANKE